MRTSTSGNGQLALLDRSAAAPEVRANLVGLLERAAASSDTGLRVLDRSLAPTWLPWPAVFERARRVARWLAQAGVEPGDAIGLIFSTCPGFFDAFFGALIAGAVPVPLYPPVRLGRMDEYRVRTSRMLQAAAVRLLLTERRVHRVLGDVCLDARPALGCRLLPDADRLPPTEADNVAANTEQDQLALIQFSSGTTRDPRPVALTHRAVVAQAMLLNGYWPDGAGTRHSGVSWLPLYHDMGLIGCVLTALERPGTLTLIPPELFVTRPAAWLQTISRYRASISPAPTFGYSLAAQRIEDSELSGVDLRSWRVALCGAEMVVPEVLRAFQSRFARWGLAKEALTPVYGLSEAALAVTFSEPSRPFVSRRFDRHALAVRGVARETEDGREISSLGGPVPGFAVRVVDEAGAILSEGTVGDIECRGPSVMEGYLRQPGPTGDVLRNGWLKTGDLGFVWQREVYVTGRRKDLLVIRGANHSPEELELAVQQVEGVRAGCAVAVSWLPDGADGERVLMLVEARRDVERDRFPAVAVACSRAVIAACAVVPDEVVVLPPGTLPRTSSGKLKRQEALSRHLAGTLDPPLPATALRMAATLARSTLAHARARLRTR